MMKVLTFAMAALIGTWVRMASATACLMPADQQTGATFDWQRPLPPNVGRFSLGFGTQNHPIMGFARPHNGIDWAGETGTPVAAAAAGIVVDAGRKGEFGNQVRIDHGGGWHTTYSQLQRMNSEITTGVCIAAGQAIGVLGNTGLSAAPHLHFEIYLQGAAVNPLLQGRNDRVFLP